MNPTWSWILADDLRLLLSYHFMLNALRAGTIVAMVAGAVGFFVVQRGQAFVGHTLAVSGFPGAAAATYFGLAAPLGYFGACVLAALVIAALPGAGRAGFRPRGGTQSAGVGVVQGFALATGLLFVSLYHGFLSGLNSLLFGSIVGVTDEQVVVLAVLGAACLAALAALGRPLLFASVDLAVARGRGVPVRGVGLLFLLLLAFTAAAVSQVVGSLLVYALLVVPAAAALRLTARPGLGLALSVLIAVAVVWAGETAAFFTGYPIGFWVTTFAFGLFLLASGSRAGFDRLGRRRLVPA